MDSPRRLVVAVAVGVVYGGSTSAVNDASSAYGVLGGALAGSALQSALRVVSTVAGSGWAWAALAVAVGWWAAALRRGAASGALALAAATTTYYAMDQLLRAEPLLDSDIWLWCAGSLLLGLPLGAVGACARRPGLPGVLAALVVPVGAAVQMVVLAPVVDAPQVAVEAVWARWLVLLLAAVAAVVIVVRHRRARAASEAVDGAGDRSRA